jgi:hypothetical protein
VPTRTLRRRVEEQIGAPLHPNALVGVVRSLSAEHVIVPHSIGRRPGWLATQATARVVAELLPREHR